MVTVPKFRTGETFQAAPAPNALALRRNTSGQEMVQDLTKIGGQVQQAIDERDKVNLASFGAGLLEQKQALLSDPDSGFLTTQGANAAAGQQQAIKRWQQAKQQAIAELPKHLQQRVAPIVAQYDNDFMSDIDRHVAAQDNVFRKQTAQKLQETSINEATLNFNDWNRVLQSAGSASYAAGLEADRTGMPRDEAQQEAASAVQAAAVIRQAQEDPVQAEARYHQIAGTLTPAARVQIEKALVPYLDDQQSDADADWLQHGGPMPGAIVQPHGEPSAAVRNAIDTAAKKYGVPASALYALAEQESGFDPKAVNPEALDDGDHATGLFQYRASTAKGLGNFDRTDPVASADAAAKQLRQRLDKGGIEYAIAGHFAGDDGADAVVNRGKTAQNPKTALYVRQVQARAQRWQASGTASSPTDLQGRLQQLPVNRRAAAERKYKDQLEAQKLQQQQADADAADSIFQTVIQAPITTSLTKLLNSQQMVTLAQNEKLNGAISRYRSNAAKGLVPEDDPVLMDKLQRLRADDPSAFAKQNLAEYADKLSGDTYLSLRNAQKEASKPQKQAQWATEGQLLSLATTDMGLDGEDNAKKRGLFLTRYYQAKKAWMQKNGNREPTADEMQGIVNPLKLPFVKSDFFGTGKRYGFQDPVAGFHVPDDDRAEILKSFGKRGINNPTEQQITAAYINGAGSDL
ncbi:MAG: transglycosylase SLT domain-containing protein [Pseudomonas sp.]